MALRLSEFSPENTSVLKRWTQSIEDRLKWLEKYGKFKSSGNFVLTNAQTGPGTGQWWMTPTHMSYRPLTNPLVGTHVSTSPAITINAFTMRVGHQDISISGGQIASGLAWNTLYFVYYDDITLSGGAVTFYCDAFKEVAIQGDGRLFVGSVRTPASATSPDTLGNNDGGVGAQSGGHVFRRPATRTQVCQQNGAPFSGITNASACQDGDWTTYSESQVNGNLDTSYVLLQLSGFGSLDDTTRWFTHSRLRVKAGGSVTTESDSGATEIADIKIRYSTDGGRTWTTIRSAHAAGGSVTQTLADQLDTVTLPDGTNPPGLVVEIQATGNADPSLVGDDGTLDIRMYEASFEGDY